MNDRNSSDQTAQSSTLKWFFRLGFLLLLVACYLLAGPWAVVIVYDFVPGLGSDDPLAKAMEGFLYPAMKLGEVSEIYGDYFWYALRGLGG